MKEKTINEIIQTMTEEEIKQHEDLIKECLKREREYIKRKKQTNQNINQLFDTFSGIIKNINKLNEEHKKIQLIMKKSKSKEVH